MRKADSHGMVADVVGLAPLAATDGALVVAAAAAAAGSLAVVAAAGVATVLLVEV